MQPLFSQTLMYTVSLRLVIEHVEIHFPQFPVFTNWHILTLALHLKSVISNMADQFGLTVQCLCWDLKCYV
jgi:hypothetical protein